MVKPPDPPPPPTPAVRGPSPKVLFNYEYHDLIEPTLDFFYRSRTLTTLGLLLLGFGYVTVFVADLDVVFNFKLCVDPTAGLVRS